jgi:predicted PurR-regulated permease PerM
MNDSSIKKYVFFSLFVLAGIFFVIMLWPFATIILLSLTIAAVFAPLYHMLARKMPSWLAALLSVIAFILILCVPVFFIGSIVFDQSQNLAAWVAQNGGVGKVTVTVNTLLSKLLPSSIDVSSNVSSIIERVTNGLGSFFSATVSTIFSLLLVALCLFYFLKDGKQWKAMLVDVSPLSDENSNKIIHKLRTAATGIIKGYLLIAIIQGLLMGIGMYLFKVPHAALWGVLAGVASLIPTIGTSLISVPAIIFLAAVGREASAIGFALWAALLVGSIDNVLNPIIVGRSIDIHPLLVLFAVLGGIGLMGPVGILIGPLIVSFLYALASVYKSEVGA